MLSFVHDWVLDKQQNVAPRDASFLTLIKLNLLIKNLILNVKQFVGYVRRVSVKHYIIDNTMSKLYVNTIKEK